MILSIEAVGARRRRLRYDHIMLRTDSIALCLRI